MWMNNIKNGLDKACVIHEDSAETVGDPEQLTFNVEMIFDDDPEMGVEDFSSVQKRNTGMMKLQLIFTSLAKCHASIELLLSSAVYQTHKL